MNEYIKAVPTSPVPAVNDSVLRILWVKVGGLWPVNTGGRLRSFHLLDELSRKHDISVITTHHPDEAGETLATKLPGCRQVTSIPYASVKRNSPRFVLMLLRSWFSALPVDVFKSQVPAVEQAVADALASGNFDLCVADFLLAVPNVPLGGSVPVVLFSHNVEYMIWQRLGSTETSPLRRALLALEWRKMRRFESRACAAADLTVAVSDEDRRLLGMNAPGSTIMSIPTGVDTTYFQPAHAAREQPNNLVFTGSMDWHPNEDAILYFIDTILPHVRRVLPDVSLTVVGRNPGAQLRKVAAEAGVHITGTVDDVRPWMEEAAVYVVPLRIGGGTRLKIYEALAMGKAVVSTTIGAEGLPLKEGVHIVRADTPQVFADRIIELLQDSKRRQRLGLAGRVLMEQHYSWRRVAQEFEQQCRSVVRV